MIFDGVLTIAMVVSLLAGWTSANVVFALGLGIYCLLITRARMHSMSILHDSQERLPI